MIIRKRNQCETTLHSKLRLPGHNNVAHGAQACPLLGPCSESSQSQIGINPISFHGSIAQSLKPLPSCEYSRSLPKQKDRSNIESFSYIHTHSTYRICAVLQPSSNMGKASLFFTAKKKTRRRHILARLRHRSLIRKI